MQSTVQGLYTHCTLVFTGSVSENSLGHSAHVAVDVVGLTLDWRMPDHVVVVVMVECLSATGHATGSSLLWPYYNHLSR